MFFTELKFEPTGMGIQAKVMFKNGFGASIVKGPFSYGGSDGLYELAVLDKDGSLTYDTPITSDVVGYLDEIGVIVLLDQIERL